MTLIDEALTYALRGCFFDVQNQVGFGLPEESYQEGLAKAFVARGISVQPHPRLQLRYNDRNVLELIPDFIVENRVVVELKVLREDFAREHYVQLFSYLKATGIRLGFLVNFGRERIFDERRVFDEKACKIEEDWDAVRGRIEGTEKASMNAIRQALLRIGDQFGLGYGEGIYRKLLAAILADAGHQLNLEPLAKPYYNSQPLEQVSIDCMLVDGKVPCIVMALKDGLSHFDIARCESYVKNTGTRFGVALNFGKNMLELTAVSVAQPLSVCLYPWAKARELIATEPIELRDAHGQRHTDGEGQLLLLLIQDATADTNTPYSFACTADETTQPLSVCFYPWAKASGVLAAEPIQLRDAHGQKHTDGEGQLLLLLIQDVTANTKTP